MNVQPNFWRGVRNAIIPSLILWALIIWSVGAALAQSGGSTTRPTWFDGVTQYYISTAHPLPISGSISASLGGFQPSVSGARGTPFSVTTSDSSGNLPTGAVVAVTNVGTTNPMYCNVNGIAATTSDQYISANGGWFGFTIPAAITTLHCIATGGTTTVNTVGGSGLPTGTGGGSGAGSAITNYALETGGNLAAVLAAVTSQIPVGANYVGQFGPWVPLASYVSGTTAAMTGTSSTQLIAAVVAKKIYVLAMSCVNSSATGTFVTAQDGSGGTALATLAAGATFNGDEKASVGPLFSTTSGNGLFVADVTTSANVICNASGFAQ